MDADVLDLVRPGWPPLRHVRRGWSRLTPAERRRVAARIESVLARQGPMRGNRDALARLFTFLAQVETIAIEIPLRALPSAPARLRPVLRRQLCDEVFHSAIFSRLAHDLSLPASQPPAPLASAERLLDRIRGEPDLAVGAALLNLVAEAWIETLFRHAKAWGVADAVFEAVLADEERHVQEAPEHMAGLDAKAAEPAVRALERGLLDVGAEPTVALALLDLAGPEGYARLTDDLESNHSRQLAAIGLAPDPTFAELRALRGSMPPPAQAEPVEDSLWRQQARDVWSTPRDPTMQGSFDAAVGHIPKKLLTAVLVAAAGRAWAAHPRLNRVVSRGRVRQLPAANVGVRVLVADDELATVVVPEADRRSVRDIQRMLSDGLKQLTALRERRLRAEAEGQPRLRLDAETEALVPVGAAGFSVAISNPGRFGLVSGAGAFSGSLAPSTDLTIGQRRRMPVWRGVAYLPAWHVSVGCLQDHRVFDGREAGLGMTALREQLTRKGVKAILAAPDTLPPEELQPTYDDAWFAALPPSLRLAPMVGLGKYTPIVIGGAGLAAALGVGGYLLYQNLNAAGVAGAAGAAGTSGTGVAGAGASGPGGSPPAPTPTSSASAEPDWAQQAALAGTAVAPAAAATAAAADAAGRCQAVTAAGQPCRNKPLANGLCRIHGGNP